MKSFAPRPVRGHAGAPRRILDRTLVGVVVAVASAFAACSSHAAELVVDAALSARVEYSDNAALRLDPAASWRFLLDPSVSVSRNTESNQLSARLRLGFNRYTNPTVPESTDKALSLSGVQAFERSRIGLSVGYSDVSSQSIQVLGQTGINLGLRRVESLSLTPTWTYSVSELLSVNASAGYTATRFEQTGNVQVTDYRTSTGSIGFTRLLSDRASTGLFVTYSNFDTSPFVSQSETWSGNATVSYAFSPTWKGSATVGLQRVVTRQAQAIVVCPVQPVIFCQLGIVAPIRLGVVGESTQQIVPFNVELNWVQSERNRFTATFAQRVNPSGAGALTTGFQAALNFDRNLTPSTDLAIALGYIRSRSLGGDAIGEVMSLSPTLTTRLSEAWQASAGYAFTRLTYPGLDRTTDANVLFVSVTYGWPQWSARY